MGTHLWAIWADLSPFVPRKTKARVEERLRRRENRFPELSSLPSILQKLMAKAPLACHTGTSAILRTSRKGPEPCFAVVAWPSVPLPVDAGRGQQNKGPSKMSTS